MANLHLPLVCFSLWGLALTLLSAQDKKISGSELEYMRWAKAKKLGLANSASDFEYRHQIFARNKRIIEANNRLHNSMRYGLNNFSDLSPAEFLAGRSAKIEASTKPQPLAADQNVSGSFSMWNGARRVNWVEQQKVNPPGNQMGCGCSYAFVAARAVESAFAIFDDTIIPRISEQILVNCGESLYYDMHGCQGGSAVEAFKFFKEFGIFSDTDVPFRGDAFTCSLNYQQINALGDYRLIEPTVEALLAAIEKAPTAVSMEMTASFQLYAGGVIDIKTPCGFYPNHSALAVGYDLDAEIPYILFQNSFGEEWGEKGYFRFAIGTGSASGMCGIASPNNSQPIIRTAATQKI